MSFWEVPKIKYPKLKVELLSVQQDAQIHHGNVSNKAKRSILYIHFIIIDSS